MSFTCDLFLLGLVKENDNKDSNNEGNDNEDNNNKDNDNEYSDIEDSSKTRRLLLVCNGRVNRGSKTWIFKYIHHAF